MLLWFNPAGVGKILTGYSPGGVNLPGVMYINPHRGNRKYTQSTNKRNRRDVSRLYKIGNEWGLLPDLLCLFLRRDASRLYMENYFRLSLA